ncbi:MAG: calcium-translocating P-type ATPase, SERCA-type [Planctomycetota bacterium]
MFEYHSKSVEENLGALGSDAVRGLPPGEAEKRLAEYGPNELREAPREPLLKRLMAQFTSLIVIVLVVAALISLFIVEGGWKESLIIMGIVLLNGILGFIQEEKAERSLAALKKLASPKARVIRNSETKIMDSRELVPGDIVEIESGDFVPADVRIIEQMNLQLDESPLTGESTPVAKSADCVLDAKTLLAERCNMAFAGTTVTYGRGRCLVAATGMNTEVGKIAGLLQSGTHPKTPLQRKLEGVGRLLIWATLGICIVIFILGLMRGAEPMDMFMTAVSLAVAAIPEGLPAVVTIALALAVQRMVRRHVLVRKLPSVETLGSVTVICTDKTGTLTQNAMTVRKIYADGKTFDLSGAGYGPEGELSCNGEKCAPSPALVRALNIGVLCNNADITFDKKNGTANAVGDPTEAALLAAAARGGVRRETLSGSFKRIDEIPFDSERKLMSVVVSDEKGKRSLMAKGAPDVVVERCSRMEIDGEILPFDEARRGEILAINREFGAAALRVLAVAYKELDSGETEPEEKDLILCGLFAMMDPPRPEVRAAIEECRTAGIRPVMVTGDHAETAMAVARELGIWNEGDEAVGGAEIDGISDDELFERVERIRIYARVTAEHKMRIVRAWRRRGQVVAVTGDGVNDAPAIKEAEIGVSMGIAGTDVTKEASDMIITDDNFASIVSGIEEGRSIYANIKKFIHFLLSCNIGEVLTMFIASIFGLPVPLRAAQILWINLVTDSLPALALGVDPPEKDLMRHRPRPPSEPIIPAGEFAIMSIQGLVIAAAALVAFQIGMESSETYARTMAFVTLVIAQLFHSFDCRSRRRSIFANNPFGNRWLIGAVAASFGLQLLVITLPVLQPYFHVTSLRPADWLIIIGLALSPVAATEIIKIFYRARRT